MLILNARVQHFTDEVKAAPKIHILVDTIPEEGFVFQEKQHTYYAELEGLVRHFRFAGPGKGSEGIKFQVEMTNGSLRQIEGPWGLRASQTSLLFDACVDVLLTNDPEAFDRQEGYLAALTVEKALEALEVAQNTSDATFVYSWQLRADYDMTSGELLISPFVSKGPPRKPQLYISQEALEWMGDFSLKETCAAIAAEIGQHLWELTDVCRSYGLPLDVFDGVRISARRLCQLATALQQIQEIDAAKLESTAPRDTAPSPKPTAEQTAPLLTFPEASVPFYEHPHSADTFHAQAEGFDPDYDSQLTEEETDGS